MAIFSGTVFVDLIGIIVAIFAVIYASFLWSYQTWKRKKVPYFEPKFPFGNIQPLKKPVLEDMYDVIERAKEKGWSFFGMYVNGTPMFVPLDLEIIKYILMKDFNHFSHRGMYHNEKDDPLSANLFTVEGTKWKNLRAKVTPTFSSGKMRIMFQTMVDCGTFLESLLKQHDTSEPIDIKHALICYTTDIIGSCVFGLNCNSFVEPDSPFLKYGKKALDSNTFKKILTLFTTSFPNLSRTLHIKSIAPDVAKFYYDIVTQAVNYRKENNYTRNDLLQLLINIKSETTEKRNGNKGDGTSLTMNEIVAQCFLFFVAGFDTSSTTMTFALYELAIHPEIQEKVRREIFEVLKRYENKICYDAINDFEYMQQVVDETLRVHSPATLLKRKCVEEYRIPNTDVVLEKGTDVLIPVKNIHYDENIYDDPEKFDPERFTPENKRKRHICSYLPFGEGPRNCIGMRFGLIQSKVGLATILSNFRVTLNSKTKTPLELEYQALVPAIKGGLWLNLEKL